MRRRLVWPAWVLGALLAVTGIAVMIVLGPDSRLTTGPHEVDTDGVAVVTAPGVVSWRGLQVDVLAEVPVGKPVFVGIGNTVDVEDYVGGTQRLEVTSFRVPWTARTREVDGLPALPGAPTALDWWIADAAGLGGASISATLPDESTSVAVLAVGATDLSGLRVTFAYGVRGGFAKGAALALLGAGLLWGGVLLRRGVPWTVEDDLDDAEPLEDQAGAQEHVVEEVVYVYVDEDGTEHEISAEEAERLQAALEEEPEPEPEHVEPETDEAAPAEPGTTETVSAETPAGETAPVGTAPIETAPTAPVEQVLYVFVDEDGVEHEVPEDELGDWVVVDDDEEEQR